MQKTIIWILAFVAVILCGCQKTFLSEAEDKPVIFNLMAPRNAKVGDTVSLTCKVAYENAKTTDKGDFKKISIESGSTDLVPHDLLADVHYREKISKAVHECYKETGTDANHVPIFTYDSGKNEFNAVVKMVMLKAGTYTLSTLGEAGAPFIPLRIHYAGKRDQIFPGCKIYVNGTESTTADQFTVR